MGLETVAILSLAVGTASAISQAKQARKASDASEEASEINTATGEVNNAIAQRKAAREARLRRSRLLASAEASGTGDSSGFLGASSAIGANLGSAFSQQKTAEQAARGLSAANQKIADASSASKRISAFTTLANQGIGVADDAGLFD